MRKSVLDDSSVLHSLFNSTLELLVSPGGTTQYQCRAEGTCNSFPMALREEASLGRGSRSPPPGLLTGLGKSRGCPCRRRARPRRDCNKKHWNLWSAGCLVLMLPASLHVKPAPTTWSAVKSIFPRLQKYFCHVTTDGFSCSFPVFLCHLYLVSPQISTKVPSVILPLGRDLIVQPCNLS